MRFSRSRRSERLAEISVVPLIDLFLNILVFFLVTTTFSADSVFFVDLPEAQGHGAGERKMVSIAVSAKGEVAVDNRPVSLQGLKEDLERTPADKRKIFPVVLRADRNALHGAVVSVIDVIKQAGFENVGMATKTQAVR